MVTLAIEPIPEFHLLDWELEKEGPSFTIDTIRELKKRNPHQQIRLILGQDALKEFFAWKEVEELVHLAPPLVGSRQGTIPSDLPPSIQEAVRAGMTQTPEMDISSTAVRERLGSAQILRPFSPFKSAGLYSSKSIILVCYEKRLLELLNFIAQVVFDKKGTNILALDVRGLSTITDYLLIAEGGVDRHVTAIAKTVEDELRKIGERPAYVEGMQNGDWIVLDYHQVMVHLSSQASARDISWSSSGPKQKS